MFLRKRKLSLNRYGKKRSKLYLFLGAGLLFILTMLLISNLNWERTLAVNSNNMNLKPKPILLEMAKVLDLLDISELKMREILGEGCPLVYMPSKGSVGLDFQRLLLLGLTYITDLNSSDPTTILKSQMAVLASEDNVLAVQAGDELLPPGEVGEEDYYLDTPPGLDDWYFEIDPGKPVELTKDPLVLIYNTHNAETYQPTDGKSKLEGKNAGVAKVAKVMEESLQGRYGLKTVRSEVIHDYPDWARSYINSMQTAQALLKANKSIRAVFDIHRDAGYKEKSTTTVTINGKKAASIMIVLGTEHEKWRQNLAFAQKLEARANQLFPGLLRDLRILDNRRYNQNLHPGSLILEFGSDLNTLEEAQYSAALFAQVIAEVIKAQ